MKTRNSCNTTCSYVGWNTSIGSGLQFYVGNGLIHSEILVASGDSWLLAGCLLGGWLYEA
jgi:hypothetical protein